MCRFTSKRSKMLSPAQEGPLLRRRRRPSKDDSVETTPLDDSLRSFRSEELLRNSIPNQSSNTVFLRNSFSGDKKKNVSFGSIEIHSYGHTLGDNPSVSSGPPVTIEWKPFESGTYDLNLYEKEKPEPRSKEAMILPRSVREDLLRKQGFARGEMKIAAEEIAKIQQQRQKSSNDGRLIRKFEKCWRRRGRAEPSRRMDEIRVE